MTQTNKTPYTLINSKLKQLTIKTPEANLMFAVVMQAVSDLTKLKSDGDSLELSRDAISAANYLFSEPTIPHAELCGLESEYVKDVIYKIFLFMSKDSENPMARKIKLALSLIPKR